MSADLALGLSEVIGGHDRDVGAARQSGEYKQNDGREHILFGEYVTLATHAIFTAAVAMHTLLVICWNLTSRMDSAIHVIYPCIFWSGDHINIQLPVTKAGQAYSKQGAEENMLCSGASQHTSSAAQPTSMLSLLQPALATRSFEWPAVLTIAGMFSLWHLGNNSVHPRPYKYIFPSQISKSGAQYYSAAKKLMPLLEAHIGMPIAEWVTKDSTTRDNTVATGLASLAKALCTGTDYSEEDVHEKLKHCSFYENTLRVVSKAKDATN